MRAPALLLMDMQEAICRPDGLFGGAGGGKEVVRRGVLERAASVLARFRGAGYPVLHARLALDPAGHRVASSSPSFELIRANGLMRLGDPAAAICPEVAPLPDEVVIDKCGFGPFAGTHLEAVLHRLCPRELVMGGVSTNHVVESAVRHATDVGFQVVVLEDLCAAATEAAHRLSVEEILPAFAAVTSSEDYLAGWTS